jgi:hypothetical protein
MYSNTIIVLIYVLIPFLKIQGGEADVCVAPPSPTRFRKSGEYQTPEARIVGR